MIGLFDFFSFVLIGYASCFGFDVVMHKKLSTWMKFVFSD